MHLNTLKVVTVLALLASPSAFAAIPGTGALDSRANAVEAPRALQLADHRGHSDRRSGRWSNNDRQHEARGVHRRDRHHGRHYDRHHRRPHYHGHPRHYRGHQHRHFRGRPIRRFFRHWRRHH